MYALTLFSCVSYAKYEMFVVPFIYFALESNPDVQIEIHLGNPERFENDYGDAIKILSEKYPERFLLQRLKSKYSGVIPDAATARYYTVPTLKNKWTKITDIDIFHVEDGASQYFDALEKRWPESTYFALQRGMLKKLSGTFCVKTKEFYSEAWLTNRKNYMQDVVKHNKFHGKKAPFDIANNHYNEWVNYELVVPVHGGPVRSEQINIRPLQGIHISPNREPYHTEHYQGSTWGITPENKRALHDLMSNNFWLELEPHVHSDMMALLKKI